MAFMNEASWDRVLRIVLGVVLLYLGLAGGTVGLWATVSVIAGVISLATGVVGWCALYSALGFKTRSARV